ncbi:MAG: hypothetical protein WDN04_14645 [Rhodospirillales bacterium]
MPMPARILATALASLVAAGTAHAASLTVGTYGVSSYYISATGSGGGTCTFPVGTYLSSEYTYPGPSKSGAVTRSFINSGAGEYVSLLSFPTTPPKGATTWSGSATTTFLPGGAPSTGTFTSKFTVTDSKSYVAKTTYVFPAGTGSCTSIVQEVGIWTAK